MLSRRTFLAASLGVLLQPAVLAKKKPAARVPSGPHSLAREQWPPSMSPDFIAIVDKGYALIADQNGRLSIVDLKREQGPQVIGELYGIGRKIVDLEVVQRRAYALVYTENANAEPQYSVVTISISPADAPAILERQTVPYLSEPTALAVANDTLAVAGSGPHGENEIIVLGLSAKRRAEDGNAPLVTINVEQPVGRLDYQERQLVVLQPGDAETYVDFYNMFNPRNPERLNPLRLQGNYDVLARSKDMLVVAGVGGDRKSEALVISPRQAPHVVARAVLPFNEVLDVAMQKGQFLLLGEQGSRLAVASVAFGKGNTLVPGQSVLLPAGAHGPASKARLAARDKEAYVASDSGAVQVLTINKDGWQYLYSHTIPRLPAAAVAIAGSKAVVAGGDLKVYDITQPDHPVLVASAEPSAAVRSLATDGNLLLTLSREGLSLRKVDKPSDVVASLKVSGQALAYDSGQHRAYVLAAGDKSTTVTPVRVGDGLTAESPQSLPGVYQDASANNGRLLVSGLNSLALYDMSNGSQLGSRQFPNLALRDLRLGNDVAYVSAVDAASHGFLLVVNVLRPDLPTIGSVSVPQDAAALAVNEKTAVVVGRSGDGKDEASVVDVSNGAAPRLVTTFPVLEAASAVAIRDKVAFLGGRGIELLGL